MGQKSIDNNDDYIEKSGNGFAETFGPQGVPKILPPFKEEINIASPHCKLKQSPVPMLKIKTNAMNEENIESLS